MRWRLGVCCRSATERPRRRAPAERPPAPGRRLEAMGQKQYLNPAATLTRMLVRRSPEAPLSDLLRLSPASERIRTSSPHCAESAKSPALCAATCQAPIPSSRNQGQPRDQGPCSGLLHLSDPDPTRLGSLGFGKGQHAAVTHGEHKPTVQDRRAAPSLEYLGPAGLEALPGRVAVWLQPLRKPREGPRPGFPLFFAGLPGGPRRRAGEIDRTDNFPISSARAISDRLWRPQGRRRDEKKGPRALSRRGGVYGHSGTLGGQCPDEDATCLQRGGSWPPHRFAISSTSSPLREAPCAGIGKVR